MLNYTKMNKKNLRHYSRDHKYVPFCVFIQIYIQIFETPFQIFFFFNIRVNHPVQSSAFEWCVTKFRFRFKRILFHSELTFYNEEIFINHGWANTIKNLINKYKNKQSLQTVFANTIRYQSTTLNIHLIFLCSHKCLFTFSVLLAPT